MCDGKLTTFRIPSGCLALLILGPDGEDVVDTNPNLVDSASLRRPRRRMGDISTHSCAGLSIRTVNGSNHFKFGNREYIIILTDLTFGGLLAMTDEH